MGALAQLSRSTVDVEPGRTTTFAMTVRNNGTVVDRFTFEALGATAPWVTFAPISVSLFPEASGTVNIMIAPPRDPSVPAGPTPLGVRVISSEDAAGSVVEKGTANVGSFSDITVMQWSMANLRDLDYHWITPTVFGPGTQMQLTVSGCTGACTPGIYYAGHLVSG